MRPNVAGDQRKVMPDPAPGSVRLWDVLGDCPCSEQDGTTLSATMQQQLIAAAAEQFGIPPGMARSIVRGYLAVYALGTTTTTLPYLQHIPLLQALTAAQHEANEANNA